MKTGEALLLAGGFNVGAGLTLVRMDGGLAEVGDWGLFALVFGIMAASCGLYLVKKDRKIEH